MEDEDEDEDEFPMRIRRIAQLLSYGQDTSLYDPLEVAAGRLYLEDHSAEQKPSKIPESES